MDQKAFIKEVIDLAFGYLEDEPAEPNTSEFLGYLVQKLNGKNENSDMPAADKVTSEADDLGIRLVLLNRYAREYVKLALEHTPLQTSDEFPFLMALFAEGSFTKSELIHKMMLTKTSGIEVIKRLLKKGLIHVFDDLEDRRSKRVEISVEGRQLVLQLLPRMSHVSTLISGNLSPAELRNANSLLKKLQVHHRNLFENTSREEIKGAVRSAG